MGDEWKRMDEWMNCDKTIGGCIDGIGEWFNRN